MRRTIALVVLAAVASTACGVLADDDAAVVAGTPIPVDVVDDLARDEGFVELLSVGAATDESLLPGSTARTTLGFAVETQALVAETRRWGIEPDPEDPEALLAEAGIPDGSLGSTAEEWVARYLAAFDVLGERFAQLDPTDEDDLRALYEGAPSLWLRTCAVVVGAAGDDIAEVERRLARGEEIAEVADDLEGSQVLADPDLGCLTTAQLPGPLADAVTAADEGDVVGPVVVAADGGEQAYFFVVEERQRLSFVDAREQLVQLAGALQSQGPGPWLGFVIADTTEVNPRYGDGVELSSDGRVTIGRPTAPAPVEADLGIPGAPAAG